MPTALKGLAGGILLLIAVLFSLLWQASSAKNWVAHTTTVQLRTEQLLGSLRDAETGQRGYLLTLDQTYLAPYVAGQEHWRERLQALKQLTATSAEQQKQVSKLEQLIGQKFAELGNTIGLQMSGDRTRALAIVEQKTGQAFMDQIREVTSAMFDEENRLLVEHEAEANWLTTLVIVACGAITAGIGFLVVEVIRRQQAVMTELEDIVSERTYHLTVISAELVHRSKNQLALVQSISNQTARYASSIPDFQRKLSGRIEALGRSISELARHDWRSASLSSLIAGELKWLPQQITRDRISMEGPLVHLSAMVAHYVGLALHELLTNAMKHGALSNANGHVAVFWTLATAGDKKELFQLVWSETGGPPLPASRTQSGFGSVVLTRLTPAALQGEATMDLCPSGLIWTLKAPAPVVTEGWEDRRVTKIDKSASMAAPPDEHVG